MKYFLALLFFPITTLASLNDICANKLSPQFYPLSKTEILNQFEVSDGINNTELEDEEWALILNLIRQTDTETYTAADSNDAGYYLHIVDKNCIELWSGFLVGY